MLALMGKYAYNWRMDTNKIIDSLGGTVEVARLCDVKPQAVSQWRSKGIPKYRLQYLELLKPDVFGIKPAKQKRKAA